MSLDFGKISQNISLNPTAAFPLDARSYFESLDAAMTAAASARVAGSTDTVYYFGQTLAVVENNLAELYLIIPVAGSTGGTLKKLQGAEASFYVGYYLNNEFYKESTYETALPKDNTKLYIDINNNGGKGTYRYCGDSIGYVLTHFEPVASEEVAGIMKLYNSAGGHTDGTMTQKAINNGVATIQLTATQFDSNNNNVVDNGDDFMLELQTPGWSIVN